MVKITWTLLAYNDLNEIDEFIAKDSLFYAVRTVEKIYNRVDVLKKFPKSGRVVPEFNNTEFRELIEGNYRIVYSILTKHEIIILRVHQASRLLG